MRTIWLILSIFTLLEAEHIRWYGEYDRALMAAIKEEKTLLVFKRANDCIPCNQMLSTTLKDQDYIDWINQHFIAVIVTEGQKGSYPLEMLYTLTYPTLFLLTPDELFSSDPLIGYKDEKEFRRFLKENFKNFN